MTRRSLFISVASICILTLILSTEAAEPASAGANFTVNSTTDAVDNAPGDGACATLSGRCTLRAAVQETNALPGADGITVPPGTYVLGLAGALEDASVTGDLDISDDVMITGSGAPRTIIDGTRQDRVLHVTAGSEVQLSGVTVRNGLVSADLHGGGIFNSGTLTVSDSVISSNAAHPDAGHGGGAYNAGTMTVANSTVSGNTAFLLGGLGSVNALTVIDTAVTGNTVKGFAETFAGAGIGVFNGSLTIVDSTVTGNSTPSGAPGGIGVLGDATISGSTVSDNSAGGVLFGGGVAHANGRIEITNSTISGNTSAGFGGALAAGGETILTNVTMSGNSAASDGGAIAATGTTALNNVTITNNTADSNADGIGDGGGIATVADPVTISNTVIAGNFDRGGELPDCNENGLIVSQGYNLVQNTAGCPFVPGPGDITGRPAGLSPLADNGGPTRTHALLRSSPAIDAGNPAAPAGSPTCEPDDQRGVSRPQDGNGDGVSRCDIGAFERRWATTASTRVLEHPVAFQVANSNTSGFACPSDQQEYTVRGHLVGPAGALASTSPAVTFYLYGLEGGEFHWRITEELAGVSGYDWPLEMAKLGHVSLTIDMLGYDSSVTPEGPHGFLNCIGSQADVTHQIVGQLRSGQYSLDGGTNNGTAFAKVVVAGHDVGGPAAEIEAYSYKDIDGLMTVQNADQGFSDYIINLSAQRIAYCASTGGENREQESQPPVGPGGYFYLPSLEDWRNLLFEPGNSDPRVVDTAIRLRNRNPCMWLMSLPAAFPINRARLREVDVPVLLVFPENDPIFTRQGQEQQRGNYCPEPEPLTNCDVEAEWLAGTGHFPMLEKTAPQLRALVADWLCSRGLVSEGGPEDHACG